ncbi:MAG: hypothetical protein Q9170_003567 [Blastenia crenularia]
MHSFKVLLLVLPFLAQAATAYWYVDFYEHGCEEGAKAGTGTMTLSGKDGEEKECNGGPLHEDGADVSRSVGINGISGSGLVVDLYAAQGCPDDSFLTTIAGDDCFTSDKGFSRDHPGPKFAALRLWSAPHFWPLMNGLEKRHLTAFMDGLGRAWEWNLILKDMPHSDTSIHHTASQRMTPFRKQLKDRVLHRGDLFMVMGIDEEDLFNFTTATIFAIQTEPWRCEVDLWRSFINLDMAFLDFLDELNLGWLD